MSEASEYLRKLSHRLKLSSMLVESRGSVDLRFSAEEAARTGKMLEAAAEVMAFAGEIADRRDDLDAWTVRIAARREWLLLLVGMSAGSAAVTAGSAIMRLVLG